MPDDTDNTTDEQADWTGDRLLARAEYELYKEYGRPQGPYHLKCLACGDVYEQPDLHSLDDLVRRHAGVHGGLKGEDAEVVALDNTGRELWRHHAVIEDTDAHPLYAPCPACERRYGNGHASCPYCSHVPESNRLDRSGDE